jgi:membrane protein
MAQSQFLKIVAEKSSPDLAADIEVLLRDAGSGAVLGGPLGAISLLLLSVAIFVHLQRAFDRVWGIHKPMRRGVMAALSTALYRRLKAFLMLLGLGAGIVVTFVSSLVLAAIATYSDGILPGSERLFSWIHIAVSLTANWFLFTVVLKTLPRADVPWRAARRGGMLASIVWEVGRQVLAAVLIGKRFTAFGVVSSFLAIMVWIYFASAVVILAAEFVQVVASQGVNAPSSGKPESARRA